MVLGFGLVLTGCDISHDSDLTLAQPSACQSSNDGQTNLTESELENAIRTKLNQEASLAGLQLQVEAKVDQHEVSLTGEVESQAQRRRAVELARTAQAGWIVIDQLDVKSQAASGLEYNEERAHAARLRARARGETVGESLDDAWVHTKIVTKLIDNPETTSRKIKVDVTESMVTLRGTVATAAEKVEAGRVAKATEGVKQVSNQLRVSASF